MPSPPPLYERRQQPPEQQKQPFSQNVRKKQQQDARHAVDEQRHRSSTFEPPSSLVGLMSAAAVATSSTLTAAPAVVKDATYTTTATATAPFQKPGVAVQPAAVGDASRAARRRSLSELGFGKLATYKQKYVLGTGTYSTVYKGTSKITNKAVAIKEIRLVRDEGIPFTAIREISLLRKLKHNNIITLHDVVTTSKVLLLVFEFVERDLSAYIDDCNDAHLVPIENVSLLLFQLLRALAFCHAAKILHRDIKPQNILISSRLGQLKLADFGLARAQSVPTKSYSDEVVTLWFRPPDVLLGSTSYDSSIDIWGVGCIFYQLVAGRPPFVGENHRSMLYSIFETLGTPNNESWPGIESDATFRDLCKQFPHFKPKNLTHATPRLVEPQKRHHKLSALQLLQQFLCYNPKQRISAESAMKHDYFSHFPPQIHNLRHDESIFVLSELKFVPCKRRPAKRVSVLSNNAMRFSLNTNETNYLQELPQQQKQQHSSHINSTTGNSNIFKTKQHREFKQITNKQVIETL